MHPILLRVTDFLLKAQEEGRSIDEAIIKELGEAAVGAVAKAFTVEKRDFTLRASNVGRPTCQLYLESKGHKKEIPSYSHKMRFLIGDMVEHYAICIMRAAGVNIEKIGGEVELGGLKGHFDVIIDGKIYDIKSASDWSYKYKMVSYENIKNDDPFGYVVQAAFYQEATGIPFGGWIIVNKSTGEWNVVEFPHDDQNAIDEAIDRIAKARDVVEGRVEPEYIKDVPEVFYKKDTGNRVLTYMCSQCDFKRHCFPTVQYRQCLVSKAKSPTMKYYTVIDRMYEDKQREGQRPQATANSVSEDTE